MNPWHLYDALIEGVDRGLRADFVCCGAWRSWVESGERAGIATLLSPGKQPGRPSGALAQYQGWSLRELAALVKSWDSSEAAIGAAAINAYYNHGSELIKRGASLYDSGQQEQGDAFACLQAWAQGKKVATVGHFSGVEQMLGQSCDFTVFEREPQPGDLPDAAEEYLLPEMELVFITGMAFTNKTLPRLLQLCSSARVVLVGPSTPLSAILFDFGVDLLSGLSVAQRAACRETVTSDQWRGVYEYSNKVLWSRE